jgi:hypothetical protein
MRLWRNITIILVASLAGSGWGLETGGKWIGDVAGHGGCNRFFGHYTYDGSAIKIGPLASTRMAHPR